MQSNIYAQIKKIKESRGGVFFLLIDPEKTSPNIASGKKQSYNKNHLENKTFQSGNHPFLNNKPREIWEKVDFVLVGASSLKGQKIKPLVDELHKKSFNTPVVLFPGGAHQLTDNIDAVFFMSLLSGRDSKWLIEEQVAGAPFIYQNNLESIPTAYLLIDSGKVTSVNSITQTKPLPSDDIEKVFAHCLAAKYLGMKLIYLEAGSGAKNSVPFEYVEKIAQNLDIPLIVGGGIKSPDKIKKYIQLGATGVVVGNYLEKDKNFKHFKELADSAHPK